MAIPLPVGWLPGADVANSLADAVQQNLDELRRKVAAMEDVIAAFARRDLSNNTASDLTITGSYKGPNTGGAAIRTRGDTNDVSFLWNSSSLDIYIDGTHVIRIETPSFPRDV